MAFPLVSACLVGGEGGKKASFCADQTLGPHDLCPAAAHGTSRRWLLQAGPGASPARHQDWGLGAGIGTEGRGTQPRPGLWEA